MNNLQTHVLGYLETLGFNFLDKADNYLTADKVGFGGTHDTLQIWTPIQSEDEDISQIERHLLRDFEARTKQYPNASRWIVADTFGGFTRSFRSESESKFGIKFRVPIQFFDTPFKSEESTEITSKTLTELRRKPTAIAQPFSVLADGESQETGQDLLQHLHDKFRFAEGAGLHIIVGPAGVGKTWFFRNLFAGLYDHFLDQKRKQEAFPRPIPLVPPYLVGRGIVPRMQDLVREFIQTEVANYVPQPTFEWMLTHGYAVWLFDGLDELYAGDPLFFEILADLLTRPPDGKAQILICARESLLSSSASFVDFLKDFPPGRSQEPKINLYRLDRWDHSSKSAFAGLRLSDPQKETQFLTYISASESVRALSSLPYYCNLLIEEYKEGRTEEFADDFALIDHAVSGIIDRETKKGVFVPDNLQPSGLDEWLETVASVCYTANFKGISKADAETYAMLVLHPGLSEEERQNTITTLVQFPLLARGVEAGVLTFEHELIAEFLVGRHWLRRLVNDPSRLAHEFSTRVDFADSLIGRYIASQLPKQPGGIEAIAQSLKYDVLPGKDFTVLLQMLLMAVPAQEILKDQGIKVEGRDLSEVRFVDRNLTAFSFRNCSLTNTVFQNCNLQNARFEGSYIAGTRFSHLTEESLEEAHFGNIEQFELAYVGQRRIEDRTKFAEWVQKVTGRAEPIKEPCPTVLQVRVLFLKFVHPDGSGHRSEMAADILSRGKRHAEAPAPDDCLTACIRAGYLQSLEWHDRVRRVPGNRFDDIVEFVKDWKVSENMREMLNTLCPIKGCKHIPDSYITQTAPNMDV
jgi:hypothetical protein